MNAEHWQQIDDLFQAALELEPRQRITFLEKACSDDLALRKRVEALLASDADGWNFIDTPALELAAPFLADEQPQLTAGQRITHYEIISLIGRGGMSEVYLARDKTLNRRIALKLLPVDYTRNSDRLRRFQREAQAASALNHPNILTIHQLGHVDGQQFIATEFIEGQTLRERIKVARLSLSEALDITIQITSALAAAHKAGIVHRDIKPENIMVRPDGYVKVLDFGLAKLTEQYERIPEAQAADDVDISSGVVLGTVKYMSPEQAGGLMVDQRSDIFSLGAVLYEIVTGHPPFEADVAADLIKSIMTQEPTSVDEYLPNLPDRFRTIVGKALSKNRETRYQRAEDLLIDLKVLKEEIELEAKFSQAGQPQSMRPASVVVGNRARTSTVEYLINAFRNHKLLTKIAVVIFLAAASLVGYFSYKFRLRDASTSSRDKTPQALGQAGRWTTKPSISSPRYQAEPAVLNGVLYVAGGWNVCSPYATLESYDQAGGRWIERAPMHTARGGHGVGVLNGLLYAVGGMVNCGVETSSVEAYDPATNTWSAKASLPTTRANHVVAVVNGKLYAIGGDSGLNDSSAMTTEYDPGTNTWRDRAPMPTPRRAAAAAVVNNVIYVLGGVLNAAVTTVEAYNPATNAWAARASLPTPRDNFGAAAINGVIYAMGGPGNKRTVDVYDPATDTWSTATAMPATRAYFHSASLDGSIFVAGGTDGASYLSSVVAFTPDIPKPSAAPCPASGSWATKAPMPTMRGTMATGEINGILYVVGGGGAKFFATNEAYDPNSDTWTTKKPMPTARSMAGTNNAVVNGILYVIGGNTPGHCTNVNEAYDPSTDSWTTRAPMPTARCHLSVVALDGLIYAIGGNSNNAFSSLVEVYHPATNAWTTAAPMPTARQAMAVGSVNGILYAVGGLDLSGSLDVVEAYNPMTNTWSTKARMPMPRHGLAAGVLNDSLVVVGGSAENENGTAIVEIYDPATDSWRTEAPMPTPRGYLSAATVNNTVYVLGNSAGPVAPLATNEAYIVSCSH